MERERERNRADIWSNDKIKDAVKKHDWIPGGKVAPNSAVKKLDLFGQRFCTAFEAEFRGN